MDKLGRAHSSVGRAACLASHLDSRVSLLAHSSAEAKSVSTCIQWSHPEPAASSQVGRYVVTPVQCSKMFIGCFKFLGQRHTHEVPVASDIDQLKRHRRKPPTA